MEKVADEAVMTWLHHGKPHVMISPCHEAVVLDMRPMGLYSAATGRVVWQESPGATTMHAPSSLHRGVMTSCSVSDWTRIQDHV
jgi:hypothetical protein